MCTSKQGGWILHIVPIYKGTVGREKKLYRNLKTDFFI